MLVLGSGMCYQWSCVHLVSVDRLWTTKRSGTEQSCECVSRDRIACLVGLTRIPQLISPLQESNVFCIDSLDVISL